MQLVGGNSALALSLTVVSNLLGILTVRASSPLRVIMINLREVYMQNMEWTLNNILQVPFWISNLLSTGVGASVPTKELFLSLVSTLLLPLILGKVILLPSLYYYFVSWVPTIVLNMAESAAILNWYSIFFLLVNRHYEVLFKVLFFFFCLNIIVTMLLEFV